MTVTIWRPVVGYEGVYKVSNYGAVCRVGKSKPLKAGTNQQGRLQVTLSAGDVQIRFQVHRLVCEAFNGPCPPGMECRHMDGDHLNNYAGNLAWGTHTQNMQDMTVHGTSLQGTKSPLAKLNESAVRTIRASGAPSRLLAGVYGVSQPTIISIRKRKTWRHVI